MPNDHGAAARRIYDSINAGDLEGFGRLLADDFVEHEETPGLAPTKDGVLAFFAMQMAAFPDMQMHVEDVVAEGGKVAVRVRYTGCPPSTADWGRSARRPLVVLGSVGDPGDPGDPGGSCGGPPGQRRTTGRDVCRGDRRSIPRRRRRLAQEAPASSVSPMMKVGTYRTKGGMSPNAR